MACKMNPFVDLMQFFTKSNPVKVCAERVSGDNKSVVNSDNVSIIIKFADGSIGNIFYSASGEKASSREFIEIFCDGKSITIMDFKKTEMWVNRKKNRFSTMNQEIGYKEELAHFIDVIKGKDSQRVSFEEIYYRHMQLT